MWNDPAGIALLITAILGGSGVGGYLGPRIARSKSAPQITQADAAAAQADPALQWIIQEVEQQKAALDTLRTDLAKSEEKREALSADLLKERRRSNAQTYAIEALKESQRAQDGRYTRLLAYVRDMHDNWAERRLLEEPLPLPDPHID